MALDDLRPKQRAFVYEYLKDLNATQAAIRAGYKEKTAGAIGNENLQKPKIQQAIKEALADREKTSKITVEWVLARIAAIAEDPEAHQRDQLKALELLGKHLGMGERRPDEDQRGIRVVLDAGLEDWSV